MNNFREQPTADRSPRPTRVRHAIVAVAVLMAVLLYLDRFCVSFAERYIKEDLSLSDGQMAWFISLFFWSYALGQVPSGALADRLGVRGVLTLYILAWSLFTALIGAAGGVISLLVMRAGCGLAQAGAYPACGNLLSRWVPTSSRGMASGLVALGGRIGGVIAPILTAYLMVLFVPLSVPARLEPRQILDPAALSAQLAATDEQPPVAASALHAAERRFRELLPEQLAGSVDSYGRECRALRDRRAEVRRQLAEAVQERQADEQARLTAELASLDQAWSLARQSPGAAELLTEGLNGVLERPDLYRSADFAGLRSLEREALDLVRRREGGSDLSPQETLRLNRLLLEATFPAEIGKLYVRGWRPVVMAYGLAGIVVALVFWAGFRNTPAEHPGCNAAERELVAGGRPPAGSDDQQPSDASPGRATAEGSSAGGLPLGLILRSRSLWLSSLSQFGTNVGWLFLVTWLARYLIAEHRVPILERSWMAALPPLAGIAGMFLGGKLTDYLTRRMGLRWGRALPMAVTRFLAAASYLACLALDSPWAATVAFACVFFFVDLGVSATWAFVQDVGGRHVGSVLGWGNMWGNIGAALAPQIYNAVLGDQPAAAEWNLMFVVCAGMLTLSGLAALGIDATIPLDRAAPPG